MNLSLSQIEDSPHFFAIEYFYDFRAKNNFCAELQIVSGINFFAAMNKPCRHLLNDDRTFHFHRLSRVMGKTMCPDRQTHHNADSPKAQPEAEDKCLCANFFTNEFFQFVRFLPFIKICSHSLN